MKSFYVTHSFTADDLAFFTQCGLFYDQTSERVVKVVYNHDSEREKLEREQPCWVYTDEKPEEPDGFQSVDVQSLTDVSEFFEMRTPLLSNVFKGRKFFKIWCQVKNHCKEEVYRFFTSFMSKTTVTDEIVLFGTLGDEVVALYAVNENEDNKRVTHRLRMRRVYSIREHFSHFGDLDVKTKFIKDEGFVWQTIRTMYGQIRDFVGVEEEAIRQIAHCTVFVAGGETSVASKRTAQTETHNKIKVFANYILRLLKEKHSQLPTKINLTTQYVNELVFGNPESSLILYEDRNFLRQYKPGIEIEINRELERLRGEMTEEQRSEQREALLAIQHEQREAKRAQAQRYANMIKTYCDKNLDEYEFCPIKNAYSSKLLGLLLSEDQVTDEEFTEASKLQEQINELLSEARARNEENNKQDCKKVQDVTKDLVRVFVCDLRIDQLGHNRFRENPRAFVRDMIEFSDIPFAKHKLQVFHGKHHSVIVETVLRKCRHFLDTYHERIEQAARELSEAEGNPERSAWEERERVKTLRLEKLQSLHDPYDAWLQDVEEAGEVQYNAWLKKRDGKNKVFVGLLERGETLKNLYTDLMTELAIERTKVHHRLHVLQLQNLIEKHKPMPYEPNLLKFREQVQTGELYEAMTAQFDEMYDKM